MIVGTDYLLQGISNMMGYEMAENVAERWNISAQQVQIFCKAGKGDGAIKLVAAWAIPVGAVKPTRTGKLKPERKLKTKEVK